MPAGNSFPKDLVTVAAGGPATALDLNGDGRPDLVVGATVLLNLYGSAQAITPLTNSTTVLTASATSVIAGGSVTFTAKVSGAAGSTGTPSGTVTFMDGSTSLGMQTLSSGSASLTTSALAAGAHSVTAVYGGDTAFNGSTSSAVSVSVSAAPPVATSTVLSASATSAVSGASITLTAQVAAVSGSAIPTGMLTFYDGSSGIGGGPLNAQGGATLTTSSLAVGTHTLTAQYVGATGFSASSSNSVMVTIAAAGTPDFLLAINAASGTATKTSPTTAKLTVTPEAGFASAVSFTCSGLPATVGCSFSPATVTPAGAAVSSTVTFAESGSAMLRPERAEPRRLLVLAGLGLGGLALMISRRRRVSISTLWILLVLAALGGMAGCGSGAVPVVSTVSIAATSGNTTHRVVFTLTTD